MYEDEWEVALPEAFLKVFSAVRTACADSPQALEAQLATNETIRELCGELLHIEDVLVAIRDGSRVIVGNPPGFEKEWDDYWTRYKPVMPTLFERREDLNDDFERWERLNRDALEWAGSVSHAGVDSSDQSSQLLMDAIGFSDFVGAHRRWHLLDHVVVPENVAASEADAAKKMLIKSLRQSQTAFVFGAPFAAWALLRGVLDRTLVDYYCATGIDLFLDIESVREQLPESVSTGTCHDLRMLANVVLHSRGTDVETVARKRARRDVETYDMQHESRRETNFIRLFRAVNSLIENVR